MSSAVGYGYLSTVTQCRLTAPRVQYCDYQAVITNGRASGRKRLPINLSPQDITDSIRFAKIIYLRMIRICLQKCHAGARMSEISEEVTIEISTQITRTFGCAEGPQAAKYALQTRRRRLNSSALTNEVAAECSPPFPPGIVDFVGYQDY